jgi:hypothetical protein
MSVAATEPSMQLIGIYRFALFFSRSLPLLIMKQQSAAPQLASCR